MADRTSAGLFGQIFEYLSKEPVDDRARAFALEMWKLTSDYDFSNYQMECDAALILLGLAKKGIDPDYPDDGECTLYARRDGTFREVRRG